MRILPPSIKRIRGGIKAKQMGGGFEDLFQKVCKLQGIAITDIPDGCRRIGPGHRDIIPVKSPFDWIITYQGQTALLDTKTIESGNFACSLIKEHQVDEMYAHERSGGKGGYVIWIRNSGHVFFISATTLNELMRTRGSFCETHPKAILLGSSFSFDVTKIFSDQHLTKITELDHTL
jgi:penicillin-binding protein-related factor A (putative recombinase)